MKFTLDELQTLDLALDTFREILEHDAGLCGALKLELATARRVQKRVRKAGGIADDEWTFDSL